MCGPSLLPKSIPVRVCVCVHVCKDVEAKPFTIMCVTLGMRSVSGLTLPVTAVSSMTGSPLRERGLPAPTGLRQQIGKG